MTKFDQEFDLAPDDKYNVAAQHVLRIERGFVDDPDDPGGATNMGISLRFLRTVGLEDGDVDGDGDVDRADVLALRKSKALAIYKSHFWDRYGYADLPTSIAVRTFDMAVNMGPKQAHLILQRALNACRYKVACDGILGLQTVGTAQTVVSHRRSAKPLMDAIRQEQAAFYRHLVAKRPTLGKFLDGWLRRARA